jgi:hypothetical protein
LLAEGLLYGVRWLGGVHDAPAFRLLDSEGVVACAGALVEGEGLIVETVPLGPVRDGGLAALEANGGVQVQE